MQPQDWFGVAVRVLGVYHLILGLQYFASYAEMRLGLLSPNWAASESAGSYSPAISYLLSGCCDVGTALFLLLCTDYLIYWTYGLQSTANARPILATAKSEPDLVSPSQEMPN